MKKEKEWTEEREEGKLEGGKKVKEGKREEVI